MYDDWKVDKRKTSGLDSDFALQSFEKFWANLQKKAKIHVFNSLIAPG